MDNVTHALAGCLMAATTVAVLERRGVQTPRRFRAVATAVGIITAELPDADLVYAGASLGMGKLGYLLHHRGHTHTLLFALLSAALVWGIVMTLRRDLRAPPFGRALFTLAVCGTMSHLLLDYTNNYGVHPFWPVVNRWFYGDAVFIVEPWLWVVAIPPLLFFHRGRGSRSMLALLLGIILAAAWFIGMVGTLVAVMLTVGAGLWLLGQRRLDDRLRITGAVGLWVVVEVVFAVGSAQSRNHVRDAVGASYRDVSLTPLIGNPFCFRAIVVEVEAETYRLSNATVAPYAALVSASTCAGTSDDASSGAATLSGGRSEHTSSASVDWSTEWHAPVAELAQIVRTQCEAAAAMEFIRVPMWSARPDGSVEIGDARFGTGARGFASIIASPAPQHCPRLLPGWTPPRADLLP
ncbi:MAG: metal-dependent hydrolase [Gemmatimonas sp.]